MNICQRGQTVRRIDAIFGARRFATTKHPSVEQPPTTDEVVLFFQDRRIVRVTNWLVHSDILGKAVSFLPDSIQGQLLDTLTIPHDANFGFVVNSAETVLIVSHLRLRMVSLYSLPDLTLLHTISGLNIHASRVMTPHRLCLNAAETTLLVADYGGGVQELSLTGEHRRTLPVMFPVCTSCSSDGRLVAVGCGDPAPDLLLLSYEKGKVVRKFAHHWKCQADCVVFTPDNKRVLAAEFWDSNFMLFSVADGAFLQNLCCDVIGGWKNACFAPNGDLVVAIPNNSRIRVYESDCVTVRREFAVPDGPKGAAYPAALCVVNEHLYVLGYVNPTIHVFE